MPNRGNKRMSRRALRNHAASHDCVVCGGAATARYTNNQLEVLVDHRGDCRLTRPTIDLGVPTPKLGHRSGKRNQSKLIR